MNFVKFYLRFVTFLSHSSCSKVISGCFCRQIKEGKESEQPKNVILKVLNKEFQGQMVSIRCF